ncbi:MAG: helix-turn-helix transcriptional regulator [Labilithrix sp.]|nr:helix-turn-helix transcriptional regulator [Labilithrix sp.]MCW5835756.1 helix-turn-helix transcriptional regulator [Labilithrix sp.]
MATEGAVLDCLAACYRLDLDGAEYVRHVVEQAAPALDRGLGVIAYTYDARDRERATIEQFATSKRFDPRWLPPYYAAVEAAGHDGPPYPTGFRAWRHLPCGHASAIAKMRRIVPLFAHLGGSRDIFAVNALDASGQGLWLGALLPSTAKVSAARVTLFTRFAAHLTSALRLRRSVGTSRPRPAAVLSPSGALLDAGGGEGVVEAREELRRATVAFDQARTKKMRADVELATRRWRPLVGSRWSLLDEFDTDGHRFIVAVENAPPTRSPRKDLSEREHQVMTQAHLGHTDKVIAYELGLSTSTVRVLLHRATRKLGAPTRREALARFDALTRERVEQEPKR